MAKQTHNANIMDTEHVGKLLFQLATPAFFGMFVQTLYNVVNTIFIGHTASGDLAIAGLSIVFPIQMFFMGVGMMVGMGGTSLISRSIGARDTRRAERTLGNGITCIIILSLLLTAIILPNIDSLLRLIGASDEVLPYAHNYLQIIVYGTVFNLVGMALLNFVRAEGNARVAMIANILGAGLNIILDWVLIIHFNMSVTGAALGTVIAQVVVLIYLGIYYLSKSSYIQFHAKNMWLDVKILKPMFSIGISSFVQTAASSVSAMFLISRVAALGGDVYLGAFGIIQRVMMFATMPAMVTGQGVQPILGFNYGAKRYMLALKALRIAAIASTCFSVFAFAILYFIPGLVINIFSTDMALVDAGVHISHLVFWSMPLMGLVMVGSTSFMSIGKAVQAFTTAIARPALFLIPAVLVLPLLLGLDGVFLSFPTSDALTLILTIILIIPVIREFQRNASKEGKLAYEPARSSPPDRSSYHDNKVM
jgi:putative MATE family efflux protein